MFCGVISTKTEGCQGGELPTEKKKLWASKKFPN